MNVRHPHPATAALVGLSLLGSAACQAQATATLQQDGAIRAAIGLGASLASGNSRASNLNLNIDVVRATDTSKVSLYGKALHARAAGVTTDEQARLGGRHDLDLSPQTFTFLSLDLEHNQGANLQLRTQWGAGLGRHILRDENLSFDIFGGPSYTRDRYIAPTVINGVTGTDFTYPSLTLGEESTHQLTDSTSFKQRLTVLPNLKDHGEYRANLDATVAVAINKLMSLTVGTAIAHNSEPGPGRKSTDTLFTTGIAVKFD